MSQEDKVQILVMLPVKEIHQKKLEQAAPGAQISYTKPEAITKEQVHNADIIIGNVPAQLIEGSAKLKWLQLNSAGTDGYLLSGILPAQAKLTNATGAYGLAISEYMMTTLLMMMKKMDRYYINQAQGIWKSEGQIASVYGAKILVVGMGDIGSEFAKRAYSFGAKIIGVTRTKKECPDYVDQMITSEEMDSMLGEVDVVVSSLPSSLATYHLFNQKRFHLMKKGCYFVNVGRGNAVDSEALYEALQTGQLAGAGVDVTDPEPLPKDHPLWYANNIIITPHISGFYHLPETFERVMNICVRNLENYMQGKELENQVDFETGYRKSKG